MKGSIGVPTSVYGIIIPHSTRLSKIPWLSKGAKIRLVWMDHYRRVQNARKVCRYFGISPTPFYKWQAQHQRSGPLR